jgi:hypothetical protein
MNNDAPQVIEVIKLYTSRGAGTEEDRCRMVLQIWTKDGKLLAENDPCAGNFIRYADNG